MTDAWRAQFDAEVTFRNGGRLAVEACRLDVPGAEIADGDLAALFVRHLGLLMVGEVRISGKQLLRDDGLRWVALDLPVPPADPAVEHRAATAPTRHRPSSSGTALKSYLPVACTRR